jgi:hypothetical protein
MVQVAMAEARVRRVVKTAVWVYQATTEEAELVAASCRRFPSSRAFRVDDATLARGFLTVIRREFVEEATTTAN